MVAHGVSRKEVIISYLISPKLVHTCILIGRSQFSPLSGERIWPHPPLNDLIMQDGSGIHFQAELMIKSDN